MISKQKILKLNLKRESERENTVAWLSDGVSKSRDKGESKEHVK